MNEERYSMCKLCLEQNSELLNIFSNNIDAILQQFSHFKFQDTFASIAVICKDCWQKVQDFHEFCMKIEKIHEEACRLAEQAFETNLDYTEFFKVEDQVAENETEPEAIKEEIDVDLEDEAKLVQIEEQEDSKCFDSGGGESEPKHVERQTKRKVDQKKINAAKTKCKKKAEKIPITPELEQTLKEQLSTEVDYQNADIDYKFIKKFMPLKCDICKEPFTSFSESQTHFLKKHKRAGYWKCCKTSFETIYDISDHMRYHRDPSTFKCKVCDRVFTTTYKLHGHIYCAHLREFRSFQCKTCAREYKVYHKLVAHEKQHISTNCPHCERITTIANLERHIRFAHSGTEKVMCDICGKVSCDKKAHKLHFLVEHSGIDQRIQCDICKKWVKHKKQMSKHMSKHFQTPETCNICGKTVANRYALSGHKQRHKERKHKCSYCGKEYIKLKLLREHESIHLGIKDLYQCDFCDKTFRFNSGMYAHRKRAHPQEYLTLGKKN